MNYFIRFRTLAATRLNQHGIHRASSSSPRDKTIPSFLRLRQFSSATNNSINDTETNHPTSHPFPWRTNATTPLPRLAELDDLSGTPNTVRSRFAKKLTSAVEMKTPLWQIFITRKWEGELAHNCSWAFQNALVAILSKFFSVPLSSIENNDTFVKLDSTGSSAKHSNSVMEELKGDESCESRGLNVPSASSEKEDEERDAYLSAMVEDNLMYLFMKNTSHTTDRDDVVNDDADADTDANTDDTIEIKHTDDNSITRKDSRVLDVFFYLQPISSRLENIFLVPSLTRDDVKQDESLRGAYQAIEHSFQETGDMRLVSDMASELEKLVQHGGAKRSIIMDVSIDCLEKFHVKDRIEGRVIQGDENEEKQVTHLVRFEMQTTKGDNPRERELGSWYIIDIDDMLEGNVWH